MQVCCGTRSEDWPTSPPHRQKPSGLASELASMPPDLDGGVLQHSAEISVLSAN